MKKVAMEQDFDIKDFKKEAVRYFFKRFDKDINLDILINLEEKYGLIFEKL